jgi:CubicO group peptidase (beta-lactamase class C family)/Zn-dependent protease with chaperone function
MGTAALLRLVADTGAVAVPPATPEALRYYHSGNVLWVIGVVWGLAVPAVLAFTGASARLRDVAQRISRRWLVIVIAYVALLTVVFWAVDLPLDFYAGFIRQHAYGLSNQTPVKWLHDSLLSLVVDIVAGVLVIWIPYALMRRTRRWWLYTGLAALPILIFMMLVGPVWIDPLFNRFHRMNDPVLESEILAEAHRVGITADRVFVVDKSEDTNALNAYVTGIGGTQRIVLWDTLLRKLNGREILAVTAHEMGHYVLGHVRRSIVLAWLMTLAGLFLVDRIARRIIARYAARLGFDELSDVASAPLILLVLGGLSFIATPAVLAYSRYQEHEADRFSLELTHDNHALATSFVKLQSSNLSNPWPSALYVFWRASHPPMGERIEFANTYRPWATGAGERYGRYMRGPAGAAGAPKGVGAARPGAEWPADRRRSTAERLQWGGVAALDPRPSTLDGRRQGGAAEAAAVDSLFRGYDSTHSPGCAVGVVRAGRLAYARGYGMANLETGTPLTPQSVFRLASLSKQFTAAAVLLLAQQGKLSLDDDVRKWVPAMPEYDRPMTLRELIHHTSGVRDYLTLYYLAGYRDDDFYTPAEAVAMIARQKHPNFEPGSAFLYSNSGYFLLSQVVQAAAGESLAEYAREHVFAPLGMSHTRYQDDHTAIVPDRASGYSPAPGGGYRIDMTTLDLVGDGGVFTSIEDLARWDGEFYQPDVGGAGFLTAMQTRGVLGNGDTISYAAGLDISHYRGLPTVSHGGAFVGFRTALLRFPTERFTAIVLCNISTARPGTMAERIADIYLADRLGPPATGAAAGNGTGAGTPGSATIVVPAARLALYAGRFYSDELDATYRISVQGDSLRVRAGQGLDVVIHATGPDAFQDDELRLRFRRRGGRVTGFELDAGRVRGLAFLRVD